MANEPREPHPRPNARREADSGRDTVDGLSADLDARRMLYDAGYDVTEKEGRLAFRKFVEDTRDLLEEREARREAKRARWVWLQKSLGGALWSCILALSAAMIGLWWDHIKPGLLKIFGWH